MLYIQEICRSAYIVFVKAKAQVNQTYRAETFTQYNPSGQYRIHQRMTHDSIAPFHRPRVHCHSSIPLLSGEMAHGIYENPFPALALTEEDKVGLNDVSQNLVYDACAVYTDFVKNPTNYLNTAKWRKICQREDVTVYHDRRIGPETGDKDMHLLLTVGTIAGTVEDALYAVSNHTVNDMRIHSAYVGSKMTRGAVLDTIVDSTPDDPFRFVTLRWSAYQMRLFSNARSALYVEALGMTKILDNVPIGYRLMHSVSFPGAPPQQACERFNMSVCMLWRQVSAHKVQTFITAFVQIKDKLSLFTPYVVKSVARLLLSSSTYFQLTQMKKLKWMLKHKERFHADDHRASLMSGRCSVCGSGGRSAALVANSSCAICSRSTCRLCRIKRNLIVLAPNDTLLSQVTYFCVRCVAIVNTLDSAMIARTEASERRQERDQYMTSKSYATRWASYVRASEVFADHVQ